MSCVFVEDKEISRRLETIADKSGSPEIWRNGLP
jgi:hypothetical protein